MDISYNPTVWVNGENPPMSAENLQNIENGLSTLYNYISTDSLKIKRGSYTGNGEDSVTLSFDGIPLVILVQRNTGRSNQSVIAINGVSSACLFDGGGSSADRCDIVWDDNNKSVSLVKHVGDDFLNTTGETYYYVGLYK